MAKRTFVDMQHNTASQAVLSPAPITTARVKATLNIRKEGVPTIHWRFLTQCGDGTAEPVRFVPTCGTMPGEHGDVDTSIMILSVYEGWMSAAVWRMWATTPEGSVQVAWEWLRKTGLVKAIAGKPGTSQGVFHPKTFGPQGEQMRSLTLRVHNDMTEDMIQQDGKQHAIVRPIAKSSRPDTVWLPEVETPVNRMECAALLKAAVDKAESVRDTRGIVMSSRGHGIRVPPAQFEAKAREILPPDVVEDFLRKETGVRWELMGRRGM